MDFKQTGHYSLAIFEMQYHCHLKMLVQLILTAEMINFEMSLLAAGMLIKFIRNKEE